MVAWDEAEPDDDEFYFGFDQDEHDYSDFDTNDDGMPDLIGDLSDGDADPEWVAPQVFSNHCPNNHIADNDIDEGEIGLWRKAEADCRITLADPRRLPARAAAKQPPPHGGADFIASKTFAGKIDGYMFSCRLGQVGYFVDGIGTSTAWKVVATTLSIAEAVAPLPR